MDIPRTSKIERKDFLLHNSKNIPADCFARVWVHDFIRKTSVVNNRKTLKFSWFCNIAV